MRAHRTLILSLIAAIAVAVAVQHFLIFHSPTLVALMTAVAIAAAWLITRSSLEAFTTAMRFNLGLESAEVGPLYTEIN